MNDNNCLLQMVIVDRSCVTEKRMYVGDVLVLTLGKCHFCIMRVKTEFSAQSESTRLCLGCFNPCICH